MRRAKIFYMIFYMVLLCCFSNIFGFTEAVKKVEEEILYRTASGRFRRICQQGTPTHTSNCKKINFKEMAKTPTCRFNFIFGKNKNPDDGEFLSKTTKYINILTAKPDSLLNNNSAMLLSPSNFFDLNDYANIIKRKLKDFTENYLRLNIISKIIDKPDNKKSDSDKKGDTKKESILEIIAPYVSELTISFGEINFPKIEITFPKLTKLDISHSSSKSWSNLLLYKMEKLEYIVSSFNTISDDFLTTAEQLKIKYLEFENCRFKNISDYPFKNLNWVLVINPDYCGVGDLFQKTLVLTKKPPKE